MMKVLFIFLLFIICPFSNGALDTVTLRVLNALKPHQSQIQSSWTAAASTPKLTCKMCVSLLNLAHELLPGITDEVAENAVVTACRALDLAPKDEICRPIIRLYKDQFLYIMRNSKPGTNLCALLTDCGEETGLSDWSVELDGEKGVDFHPPELNDEVARTTVVQITDVHLDLHYAPGSSKDCGERMPVCCREEFGMPSGNQSGAGVFGEMECALPVSGLDAMLNDLIGRVDHAPFILLTGDYTHSAVWQYSVQENTAHIQATVSLVVDRLSHITQAIYPVVGNHEPHVVNMYAPTQLWSSNPTFSLSWMYNATITPIIEKYRELLDPQELQRFLHHGFYTVGLVNGLRLVVLNTNLCYYENFWVAYVAGDPEDQLAWVVGVLSDAEKNNESVLVVGHVEPGSCFAHWSGEWNRIVHRFRGIIRGQFYGHAHKPHYRVGFGNGTLDPISLSVISGSALPDRMNPSYSTYQLDGERQQASTWTLLNQQMILMNLSLSNNLKSPVFTNYNVQEYLGISNFTASGVWEWVGSLICNQTRVDRYLEFHHKGTDSLRYVACDVNNATCMGPLVCGLVGSPTACSHMDRKVRTTECKEEEENSGGETLNLHLVVFCLHVLVLFVQ